MTWMKNQQKRIEQAYQEIENLKSLLKILDSNMEDSKLEDI